MKDTPSKSTGANKKKAPVTTAKKAPAAAARKTPVATKKSPVVAKKAATPKKTTVTKRTAAKKEPTYEEISRKAHEVFLERSAKGEPGNSESDWHNAMKILKAK